MSFTTGLKGCEYADSPAEMKSEEEDQMSSKEDSFPPEDADRDFSLAEVIDLTANTIPNGM